MTVQRGSTGISPLLTSPLDGGGWSTPDSDHFTPVKKTQYPLYTVKGWLGPRAGLYGSGESRLPTPPGGIRSPDRQAVASRYIAYSIPAHGTC